MPYAFASHFAPAQLDDAIRIYRERFQPSEQLARPYVMLGFNCIAADTDEEAELLATSIQQAFVNLRSGQPGKLPPTRPGYLDSLPLHARATLDHVLACSAIGSVATVRSRVENFVERTGADELMVTAQIHDHSARVRSYQLLRESVPARELVSA